jgi:hypothetical protein
MTHNHRVEVRGRGPKCQVSALSVPAPRLGRGTAVLVMVFAMLVGPFGHGAALAHGEAEYTTVVGEYLVETFDELVPGSGILYTVVLTDVGLALPIRGATVEVVARGEEGTLGPLGAAEFGGSYQVLIPDLRPEAWTIEVRVSPSDGEAFTFTHRLVVEDEPEGRGNVLVVLAAIAVALVVVAGVWVRRRAV